MITAGDFRNGLVFLYDGELYKVVEYQHHKPGKGRAFMRSKIKNLKTGGVLERSFRPDEKIEDISLDYQKMQFLYKQGDKYAFMDQESYEQIEIGDDHLGENAKFLKEGLQVLVIKHAGEIIGIDLPITIELKVTYTEPGLRGDTVSSTYKPAMLETGASIQVPLFIKIGDVVLIDTRTGEYQSRA
jgi:elongation factor P